MSDLQRFVDAQDDGGSYRAALAELRAGRKRTHWMWWVFPQVLGLGHSPRSRFFAIADLAEARAYLDHPVLGPRLEDACDALLELPGASAHRVLGHTDALKLRSSMTLFGLADPDERRFRVVLSEFFGGEVDENTLDLLGPPRPAPGGG